MLTFEKKDDFFFDSELPKYLFSAIVAADIRATKCAKLNQNVGQYREDYIARYLIRKHGPDNVSQYLPNQANADFSIFGNVIELKTKTVSGKSIGSIKINHADAGEVKNRILSGEYVPTADLWILAIKWNSLGGLYWIPKKVQEETILKMGVKEYLRAGSGNSKGISITSKAVNSMVAEQDVRSIVVPFPMKLTNEKIQEYNDQLIDKDLEFVIQKHKLPHH